MAHVRPYQPSDEDQIIHIFRETAAADLREAGDPTLDTASYIWARPYIQLSPTYCFVVDDGNGRAVGYVLGARDTEDFVRRYRERYLSYLESRAVEKPDVATLGMGGNGEDLPVHLVVQSVAWQPELMLNEEFPDLVRGYPAHLHVDILPNYQRKGWGGQLIEALCEKLRGEAVAGIHLGMVGTNYGAMRFYGGLGFERFDSVMDDGKSGEVGRARDGGVWFVKKLKAA